MKNFLFALCILLAGVHNTHAATLVNTGSPEKTENGAISVCGFNVQRCEQAIGVQVTFAQAVNVDTIEAWMWSGGPGEFTIGVHGDDKDLPGSLLHSSVVPMLSVRQGEQGWSGATGLSWEFAPGAYWIVFSVEPGQSYFGGLPFPAPVLLPAAVKNDPLYQWRYLGLGSGGALRITGSLVSAVPEPDSVLMLTGGLFVLFYTRRRRSPLSQACGASTIDSHGLTLARGFHLR